MQPAQGESMTESNLRLRQWQAEALAKAERWLLQEGGDKHFLINAAPGAGKTLATCAIAKLLLDRGEIDRVVVIAPRAEVVNQWADDFRRVTGRFMGKVTARDGDIGGLGMDVCATWSAIQGLLPEMQAVCRNARVLLICDEHHHAAVEASWGDSADSAFREARFVVVLTGTPIRSDRAQAIWLAYDDAGSIDHPPEGTYTLTYGEAVDLGYCRPVTFHRHEGRFTVDLEDGSAIEVSSRHQAELPDSLRRIPGLQASLDFYRLARTPLFEVDGKTPQLGGYQASMVEQAGAKLDELRYRMPEAGGLVIAPSIEMAEYFAQVIEALEGERPVVVHSEMPNAEQRIRAFRNSDRRWLVSVAMVSEGVDIPRLRVLIYLSSALTELAFRQAIGRVVRTQGPDDDTRAYVVMPSLETLEAYAKRVEAEMQPAQRAPREASTTKLCPVCRTESPRGAATCECCAYQFPHPSYGLKTCDSCEGLNPPGSTSCQTCGAGFGLGFSLTLDDALRQGAIVRGLDLDEQQVVASERLAPVVRRRLLQSGDENLVRILRVLPEESWSHLKDIFAEAGGG
jgi:superfamily II DNA or RNA helicase